MKRFYLAYGSNLNLKQMNFRCPDANVVGLTTLKNYRLVYKGINDSQSYLTIEPCYKRFVPLGVYSISPVDEILLDRYEGCPNFYIKKDVPILIDGKSEEAFIYIMKKEFEYYLPSLDYLRTCYKGYRDFDFDFEILDRALEDTTEKILKK